MYKLAYSRQFDKDVKIVLKRGYDIHYLKKVLIELEENGALSIIYRPHKMSGNYTGYWEAHIKSNWLIIWKVVGNEIQLARTGTHSDLF